MSYADEDKEDSKISNEDPNSIKSESLVKNIASKNDLPVNVVPSIENKVLSNSAELSLRDNVIASKNDSVSIKNSNGSPENNLSVSIKNDTSSQNIMDTNKEDGNVDNSKLTPSEHSIGLMEDDGLSPEDGLSLNGYNEDDQAADLPDSKNENENDFGVADEVDNSDSTKNKDNAENESLPPDKEDKETSRESSKFAFPQENKNDEIEMKKVTFDHDTSLSKESNASQQGSAPDFQSESSKQNELYKNKSISQNDYNVNVISQSEEKKIILNEIDVSSNDGPMTPKNSGSQNEDNVVITSFQEVDKVPSNSEPQLSNDDNEVVIDTDSFKNNEDDGFQAEDNVVLISIPNEKGHSSNDVDRSSKDSGQLNDTEVVVSSESNKRRASSDEKDNVVLITDNAEKNVSISEIDDVDEHHHELNGAVMSTSLTVSVKDGVASTESNPNIQEQAIGRNLSKVDTFLTVQSPEAAPNNSLSPNIVAVSKRSSESLKLGKSKSSYVNSDKASLPNTVKTDAETKTSNKINKATSKEDSAYNNSVFKNVRISTHDEYHSTAVYDRNNGCEHYRCWMVILMIAALSFIIGHLLHDVLKSLLFSDSYSCILD